MRHPEMPHVEGKAAEAVENRFLVVEADGKRVVRSMSHYNIGTSLNRRFCNLLHVGQHFFSETPVAASNKYIDLRP